MVNLGHWHILNIYTIFISLLLYIEKQIGQHEKYVIERSLCCYPVRLENVPKYSIV